MSWLRFALRIRSRVASEVIGNAQKEAERARVEVEKKHQNLKNELDTFAAEVESAFKRKAT